MISNKIADATKASARALNKNKINEVLKSVRKLEKISNDRVNNDNNRTQKQNLDKKPKFGSSQKTGPSLNSSGAPKKAGISRQKKLNSNNWKSLDPASIFYKVIEPPQKVPVAELAHNLDRVLFSPGIHYLQDPRSRVYNFTPYLKNIMPVSEFDFKCIGEYVTSSRDKVLGKLTSELNKKYFSSTSSMTGVLSQFHFLLSNLRPTNILNLSKNFPKLGATFSAGTKCPAVVIVKKINNETIKATQSSGTNDGAALSGALPKPIYSIDSDKSADQSMILSLLGHSMEKLLTTGYKDFENFRISKSSNLPENLKDKNESYHYATMSNFVMRSQLDCYDQRLPGTGTFDLKTRAVCAVRHDINFVETSPTGYQILKTNGNYESYERELYELIRSAMLKYSLQARIGNMDGIFICFHNIEKIFGFQYLPLSEIDTIFHTYDDNFSKIDNGSRNITRYPLPKPDPLKITGPIGSDHEDYEQHISSRIANTEFKFSMELWNEILEIFTNKDFKNDKSFRLVVRHVENEAEKSVALYFIATPLEINEIDAIQNLGNEFSKDKLKELTSENEDELSNLKKTINEKHRQEFVKINQETAENAIGYKLTIQHIFDGKVSTQNFPKPESLSTDWKLNYNISKIPPSEAKKLYLDFLAEKENIVWRSNSTGTKTLNEKNNKHGRKHGKNKNNEIIETETQEVDEDFDKISDFLQILRAYGVKGRMREELWGKKENGNVVVWEPQYKNNDY
ncbi:hypothetical protein PACTADRAFT_51981 [Pachysolen tannophilus NRRL Y-2460]|uniref:Pet127-domain-containing protein n=1 Tax=Pachysolen tannophilus NRRL Y-2460 TaxID=669874 RepID=A0A1E4TNP8_PACTA|nr:hypothetical protein PACTADRAFT_51981 [Pachysolen tannophilus NRRL Y-2460]